MKIARPSLSLLFAVAVLLLLAADVWLLFITGNEGGRPFAIAQGVLVLSIILMLVVRHYALRPIKSLGAGINLLREQDMATRLRHTGQPQADKVVDMFNSMMDALKQERLRVREQNHFLDLLIEASPMGVIIINDRGLVIQANSAARQLLAFSGETLLNVPLSTLNPQLSTLKDDETKTVRRDDGAVMRLSRLTYMDCGYAHPFILIEPLTAEVMAAERQAYGKVIRTMAHEVNNTVGPVASVLDTLAMSLEMESEDSKLSTLNSQLSEACDACAKRCRSMADFVSRYAAVVRLPDPVPRRLDLNDFVADCRVVLENLCIPREISLVIEPAAEAVTANADPVMMEQVLINLVKNSAESIGQDGRITVRVLSHPARLCVEDNGAGISPEAAPQLFAPFFSTKADGHGLGLMLVRDTLQRHRSSWTLRTDPDGLTRFTIRFAAG